MKTDRYTKFILTVIALALVALVVRDYAPVVQAEQDVVKVDIVRINGASVFGGLYALPVKIQ